MLTILSLESGTYFLAAFADHLLTNYWIANSGDDTIKIFEWIEQLREEADAAGGKVISLLGNHEWMNVIGAPTARFMSIATELALQVIGGRRCSLRHKTFQITNEEETRFVYPSEIKTFGSVAARQAMLTTGPIGRSWLKNYTTTARVPLHPSLGPINTDYPPQSNSHSQFSHAALSFVHGGLAPNYHALTPYPSRINSLAHSLHEKLLERRPQPPPHPPNTYPGLPHSATPEEHELYSANGPVWYRGWALDEEDKVCRDVESVIDKIGVRRLIMGHTPDFTVSTIQ